MLYPTIYRTVNTYSKHIIPAFKYFSTRAVQSITIKITHNNHNDNSLTTKQLQALTNHCAEYVKGFLEYTSPHIKADVSGDK